MLRQVEVRVETGEVAILLALDFVDREFGEYHATYHVIDMGQRHEPLREHIAIFDLIRAQRSQRVPSHAARKSHPNTCLDHLAF